MESPIYQASRLLFYDLVWADGFGLLQLIGAIFMSIVIILTAILGTAIASVIYIPTFGMWSGVGIAILVGNMFAVLAAMMIALKN
jgi:hypothetical protein